MRIYKALAISALVTMIAPAPATAGVELNDRCPLLEPDTNPKLVQNTGSIEKPFDPWKYCKQDNDISGLSYLDKFDKMIEDALSEVYNKLIKQIKM